MNTIDIMIKLILNTQLRQVNVMYYWRTSEYLTLSFPNSQVMYEQRSFRSLSVISRLSKYLSKLGIRSPKKTITKFTLRVNLEKWFWKFVKYSWHSSLKILSELQQNCTLISSKLYNQFIDVIHDVYTIWYLSCLFLNFIQQFLKSSFGNLIFRFSKCKIIWSNKYLF